MGGLWEMRTLGLARPSSVAAAAPLCRLKFKSEPDTQKHLLTVGIPFGALLQRCHSEPYGELRSPLGRLGIYC